MLKTKKPGVASDTGLAGLGTRASGARMDLQCRYKKTGNQLL